MADTGQLQAFAAGGPSAASDYAAAGKDVGSLKQQALTDASNRSGALYAPDAFKSSQQAMIGDPFSAAIGQIQAQQGAAGAYSGALNAAQGQYMSSLHASAPMVQNALRAKSMGDYAGALNDAQTYVRRTEADASRRAADAKKQTDQNDKQQKDFRASQKEFARQDAALDKNVDPNTYAAIADILKTADDLPTAMKLLQSAPRDSNGQIIDKSGDIVDEGTITKYITRALADQTANDAAPTSVVSSSNGTLAGLGPSGGMITNPNDIATFKQLYG